MQQKLTYLYLLTPLHTGASTNEGNMMGIAREVHTEFPYLPASSLRGRIRADLTQSYSDSSNVVDEFFGKKIKEGEQPTEGEVWFADATLLFFPIASLSHHIIWLTCPLWLERWSRWVEGGSNIAALAQECYRRLSNQEEPKSVVVNFQPEQLYLQTALLEETDEVELDFEPVLTALRPFATDSSLVNQLLNRIIVTTNEDCVTLVEMGLQREVRVALQENSKTVKGGSFRAEEAIPPETLLFFPWGIKPAKPFVPPDNVDESVQEKARQAKYKADTDIRAALVKKLQNQRLQLGGLESLGRGWSKLVTVSNEA